MKCIGRTKQLHRCKRDSKILFCHQHKLQWWVLIGIIATIGGLYQDVLKPIGGYLFPDSQEEFQAHQPKVVANLFRGVIIRPDPTDFGSSGESQNLSKMRQKSWKKLKKEKNLSKMDMDFHISNYSDAPIIDVKFSLDWQLPTYFIDSCQRKTSNKIGVFKTVFYQKDYSNIEEPIEWAITRMGKESVFISSIGPNETIEVPLSRITQQPFSPKPILTLKFKDENGVDWIKSGDQAVEKI